jgi:hypothetical protein
MCPPDSRLTNRAPGMRSAAATRLVGGRLVVFGVDDRSVANHLQAVGVDVRVGDVQVEVVPLGAHREQAVDELGDEPDVLARHDERFRDRRHQASRRSGGDSLQYPSDELPIHSPRPGGLDDGRGTSRQVAHQHGKMLHPLGMTQRQLQRGWRAG